MSGSCVVHSAGPISREWAGCRPRRRTEPVTSGQLLPEARRRHGLTQQQLADRARAQTSQAATSRIECVRARIEPSGSSKTPCECRGAPALGGVRPIPHGQVTTQPSLVAWIVETPELEVSERVLEQTYRERVREITHELWELRPALEQPYNDSLTLEQAQLGTHVFRPVSQALRAAESNSGLSRGLDHAGNRSSSRPRNRQASPRRNPR